MTEDDYIKATNTANIRMAIYILNDVFLGGNYGISNEELKGIIASLSRAEIKLCSSYDIENRGKF